MSWLHGGGTVDGAASNGRARPGAAHGELQAPREVVTVTIPVRGALSAVERVLRRAPDRLVALAYLRPSPSESGRFDALLSARGWRRWLRLPVGIEFSSTVGRTHSLVHLAWRSRWRQHLFPVMEADIGIRPLPGEGTELVFEGTYRPPAGLMGLVVDRLVGGRLALSTAEAFMEDLAAAIDTEVARLDGDRREAPFEAGLA